MHENVVQRDEENVSLPNDYPLLRGNYISGIGGRRVCANLGCSCQEPVQAD